MDKCVFCAPFRILPRCSGTCGTPWWPAFLRTQGRCHGTAIPKQRSAGGMLQAKPAGFIPDGRRLRRRLCKRKTEKGFLKEEVGFLSVEEKRKRCLVAKSGWKRCFQGCGRRVVVFLAGWGHGCRRGVLSCGFQPNFAVDCFSFEEKCYICST